MLMTVNLIAYEIIGKNNKNNFNKDIFQKNINYQEINQYNNIESINHNKVNILI